MDLTTDDNRGHFAVNRARELTCKRFSGAGPAGSMPVQIAVRPGNKAAGDAALQLQALRFSRITLLVMKTNTTNNKARLQEWSSGHFYPTKLVAFNAFSKRYDEIEPESEIVPGMIIIKMFWSAGAGDYVTVPGASLHRVNADLQLELIND